MVEKIRDLREYVKNPCPQNKTITDLAYIWMYSTCLEEEFNTDGILGFDDWDMLTAYLKDKHNQLGDCLRGHIPIACLDRQGCKLMFWDKGVAAMVRSDCEDYVLIRKG